MNSMLNRYDEKITRKLFFSMVPVQILLVMCSGVNIIIDGAFASNLIGAEVMAAAGLYGPIAKILDTVNALLFGGAQILCGKYLGENTLKRAKSVFTLDLITIFIFGIIASVLFVFAPAIPAGLCIRSSNPLYKDLMLYLNGLGPGVIPYLIGTQLTSFLQLEKKEKLGYFGIGGMFVANAFFDFLFIKVFNMGIFGLGLATSCANWVPVVIGAAYFMSGKSVFALDFSELSIKELAEVGKHGFPTAATQLMLAFKGIILNHVIFKFTGSDGLAAFNAVNSFGYVYWAVPAGMSSAMITLASIYTGEQDRSAIELLMKIYLRKAILIVAGVSVLLSLLAYPLANIYFHDHGSSVYYMTYIGFLIFPLYAPFSTFIVGMRDLWRCMNHHIAVNVIVVCDGLLFVTSLTYILSSLWGMKGVWAAQVGGCVLIVLMILIMAWVMNRKIPTSIPALCCYPKDFGVAEDRRLNLTVHSMPDVINISVKVIEFCLSQGIDTKTANRAGLCIEELAGNIVKHGFKDKPARCSCDISITRTPDGLVIKLKDNGILFNPSELDTIFNPEDPAKNIGVRLVRKICRQMEYHSLLGLNVLSVTI